VFEVQSRTLRSRVVETASRAFRFAARIAADWFGNVPNVTLPVHSPDYWLVVEVAPSLYEGSGSQKLEWFGS
jgi:hypothetical protein